MDFLDTAEIRPGARLQVIHETPDGTLTVQVNNGDSVGVGQHMADRLFVAVG